MNLWRTFNPNRSLENFVFFLGEKSLMTDCDLMNFQIKMLSAGWVQNIFATSSTAATNWSTSSSVL